MDDNVVSFTGITTLKIDAGQILDQAQKATLSNVVVVGFTDEGEFYFASSDPDAGDVLFLLERAKWRLMQTVDALENPE